MFIYLFCIFFSSVVRIVHDDLISGTFYNLYPGIIPYQPESERIKIEKKIEKKLKKKQYKFNQTNSNKSNTQTN
jgi:hypothetical protein